MELKSIIYKATFIFTIILAVLSIFQIWIKIESIDKIINVSIFPLFIFNILLIVNNINETICNKAEERKQYFKQFENDFSIAENERLNKIKDEIIYDEIRELCEKKIRRLISTICVANIVLQILLICFKDYFYNILRFCNFNFISILSTSILIIDIYYKEKISIRILQEIYKQKN